MSILYLKKISFKATLPKKSTDKVYHRAGLHIAARTNRHQRKFRPKIGAHEQEEACGSETYQTPNKTPILLTKPRQLEEEDAAVVLITINFLATHRQNATCKWIADFSERKTFRTIHSTLVRDKSPSDLNQRCVGKVHQLLDVVSGRFFSWRARWTTMWLIK